MASQQVTGNIGMYYAAYRLSRMGWNVMPTSRNARGIDLLIYNAAANDYKGIQVKALSKLKPPVPLGKSIDILMGDWWIIVTKAVTDSPECFIMRPDEVKALAHRGEKEDRVSYWLQPSKYRTMEFREAWHRIGPANGPSGILSERYDHLASGREHPNAV
jgi:hypothetical protein